MAAAVLIWACRAKDMLDILPEDQDRQLFLWNATPPLRTHETSFGFLSRSPPGTKLRRPQSPVIAKSR